MTQRIIIVRTRHSSGENNINEELQWIGNSLGLFNLRDKDSSCFRVFITLVKKTKRNEPLSSDEIASKLNLSRGTVVHHLNRLMESGIIIHEREGYLLRENKLQKVMQELRGDVEKTFSELSKVAQEIDEKMGP